MNNLIQNFEEVMRNEEDKHSQDEQFIKLRNFYNDMKSKGAVIQKPYSLPLLDTVGKRLYQIQNDSK